MANCFDFFNEMFKDAKNGVLVSDLISNVDYNSLIEAFNSFNKIGNEKCSCKFCDKTFLGICESLENKIYNYLQAVENEQSYYLHGYLIDSKNSFRDLKDIVTNKRKEVYDNLNCLTDLQLEYSYKYFKVKKQLKEAIATNKNNCGSINFNFTSKLEEYALKFIENIQNKRKVLKEFENCENEK